ncbi:hypothetical protein L1049_001786 [Liquidambar formosana]|uniref:Ribosomal RNA small subunit methyltransferase NEP1 n=1 Tax=Liquidambar formosana TaxID=63359 RepID=A0AAP0N713_LIQFO
MLRHCSFRRQKRKREEKPPCLRDAKQRKKGDVVASTSVKKEDLKKTKKIEEAVVTLKPRGIPPVPNVQARAIFMLDKAPLRKGLIRKRWKILNSEEDADFLLKQKKNLNDYRPDIVHEAVRAIFDSPLNRAGMVGAVYVKIDNGVWFEIKTHVRIPRTCKRFCGVMLKLLEKSCIRDKDMGEILIRVIEEPVIPSNSRIVGLSYSSEKLVDIEDYVCAASDDLNLVFVVGTMVNGKINRENTDDFISISNYPLGSRCCMGQICEALEQKWKIY